MKRKILIISILLLGMSVFAQNMNMSLMLRDYQRPEGSFTDRLAILEAVRDEGIIGIGDFYHEALQFFLLRASDIRSIEDRRAAEASARILAQGLGEERYREAAQDLWQLVLLFDVVRDVNQGLEMQDALIALGQIGAIEFLPHIIQRLDDLNTQPLTDIETRRRIQRAVVGCVFALEHLADPLGFRPVFFVSIGAYDPSIKAMASVALPNIAEDPSDIIIGIIQNPSNNPDIKNEAFHEMLRTNAPPTSIARVAAAALETGWYFSTTNVAQQRILGEMRKAAIDAIRIYGAASNSIYPDLRRSYFNNYNSTSPDMQEIGKTLDTLSALGTDESVRLLLEIIRGLQDRRQVGPWRVDRERAIYEYALIALGSSGTTMSDAIVLLNNLQHASEFTWTEQSWATNALRGLGL